MTTLLIDIVPWNLTQWVDNQGSDISAPSAALSEITTHDGATTHEWDADTTTAHNLVSLDITHEFDYSRATMPLESVTAVVVNGEYDYERDEDYDFVDPTVAAKLAHPGSLQFALGYVFDDGAVETVQATKQRLAGFTVDDDDMYATFSGESFTGKLEDDIFLGGRYDASGIPASTLFTEVLESARFPALGSWNYILGDDACVASDTLALWDTNGYTFYRIDPALDSVLVYLPIPPVSHREALVMLAAYSGAYLIHRPDGSLSITTTLRDNTDYTYGETHVYDRPVTINGARINRVTSALRTYTVAAAPEDIYDADVVVPATGEQTITITHDACDSGSVTVTSGGTIVGSPVYRTYATTLVVNATDTTVHVTLTGKRVTLAERRLEKTYLASGEVLDFACPIASDPTRLIAAMDHYAAVASATRYEFTCRDDPHVLVADRINLQLMSAREYSVWNYVLGAETCVASDTLPIQTTRWDNIVPVVTQKINRKFDGALDATYTVVTDIT